MINPLLILLLFIILLFLAMVFGVWFMGFFIKKFIGEKHTHMEEIISTGKVPYTWSKKFDDKINKLKVRGGNQGEVTNIVQRAHKNYLKRLKNLVKYIEKTRLVEDEDTREAILADLHRVRSRWEVKNLYES